MFWETILVVICILITHIVTRRTTIKEFDERLLKKINPRQRFDDSIMKNKLVLSRLVNIILAVALFIALVPVQA